MPPSAAPYYRRIAIVGVSGSGKTTLARQLSQHLSLPHVELDALHWDPGWVPTPAEVFRQRARQALQGASWVVDGNHPEVRDIIWSRADTVIWLDYGLALVMWRLMLRTLRRAATREVLWNGNRERTLRAHFFSRDSIFLWALRTYGLRRKEYPALFKSSVYAQVRPVHLRSPRATRSWLASLLVSVER
ncbi:MAG TPA: EutP/PduV family microcompartment system protein [Roseiflexaceae bacterium]